MSNKLKAAIYLYNDENLSMQEERCRAIALSKDWQVNYVYIDNHKNKPELDRALQDAEKGLYKFLILFKLDSLGTKTEKVLNIVDNLVKKKINVFTCLEFLDTSTPQGKFVLTIYAGKNEFNKSIQLTNNKYDTVKNGLIWGYVKQDNKIIIDNDIAKVINNIYKMYYLQKMDIEQITDYLNSNGVISPTGESWCSEHISDILKHINMLIGEVVQ